MQVLVIGAGGFVGSTLTRALTAQGYAVRGLTRNVPRARARLGLEAELHEGSLADPAQVAEAARGCQALIHAAGIRAPDAPARALSWVHVAGTENVLRGARFAAVRRVITISCADVSLVGQDRMHWDERRALPERPLGDFARSKLMAEELALAASDAALEVTALRPALLWGEGDVDGVARLAREAQRGGLRVYDGGHNLLATTHIENLVNAAISCLHAPEVAARAYYITDGEFLEAREVLTRLAGALGLPSALRSSSLALAKLRARLSISLGGGRDEALAAIARRGHSALFDLSSAIRDLGYRPQVSFADGLARLGAWLAERGDLTAVLTQASPAPQSSDVDAQVQRAGGDSWEP